MPEVETALTVGHTILSEAGIVSFILFLVNAALGYLYFLERRDRREAWKAHSQLAKDTNEVLSKLTVTLEVIRDRM